MIYAVKESKELNADCIIQTDDMTVYVCYLNPSLVNRASETPIEEQQAWKIERIQTIEEDGVKYTRTTYPNGQSNLYSFCPAHATEYNYQYQI